MWPCPKCREQVEDNFDVCWNCGMSKDGVEDPDFQTAESAPETDAEEAPAAKGREQGALTCLRCNAPLDFVGTKSFHEGRRWGMLGDLGEMFVNRERFDVYCCPRCGRVEFFVDGVGEQLRPE